MLSAIILKLAQRLKRRLRGLLKKLSNRMTSSPHSLWSGGVSSPGSFEFGTESGTSVFATLACNILLDDIFVQPNRGYEIPHTPDAAVEVHITNELELLLEMGT